MDKALAIESVLEFLPALAVELCGRLELATPIATNLLLSLCVCVSGH